MKRTLSFFLTVVMVLGILTSVPVTVNAASVDNLTFVLNAGGESYSVTDCDTSVEGEIIVPDVYEGLPVISIGSSAFENCGRITSITIPDSVTSIGSWAFAWCSALTSITIPVGVTKIEHQTFRNCVSLTSVVIGNNVTSIGNEAFINCSNLSSVIIPDSVTSIGNHTFCNCDVTSITIPDSVTKIGDYAFMSCNNLVSVIIGDGVTTIGEGAFLYCDNLTSIAIPDNVTSIGVESFGYCESEKISNFNIYGYKGSAAETYAIENGFIFIEIEDDSEGIALTYELNEDGASYSVKTCDTSAEGELVIPDTYEGLPVTAIGVSAFWVCKGITSVVIPDSVTSIGSGAFSECIRLSSITIPDSITSMGDYPFVGTEYYNNEENWENGVLYIGNHLIAANHLDTSYWEFTGNISGEYSVKPGTKTIAGTAFAYCTELTSIAIPDSVTSIGDNAFDNCTSLTSVTIPEGVENISWATFSNCTSLTSVTIPEGVTNIGTYAFLGCTNLTSLTIPNSVTSIGSYAFADCTGLSTITIPDSVTNIEFGAFNNCCLLSDVYYSGSETQWNDILIDTGFNEYLLNAKIHYGNAHAHISSDWITDKEPTCAKEGSKYKECTECKEVLETQTIAKKEHTASGWKVDKDATCTETGSKYKECTECEKILETEEIAKKDHTPSSWKTEKKATVDKAGKKVKKCTECGKTLDTATIKQLKCSKPKLSKIENTVDGVKITWGKVSGADTYAVYRKTSSGSYSKIGTTTRTYYTDKKASSGKKYYYIVKAVNEAGSSDSSSSKSIVYLADTTLKTPSSTKKGIVLKWSKVSGADGYMVYRKTGSGSYSKIATVKGSSKITYTDKKAKKGKTYTYKVKAYKSKTYSAYSNTKKIKDKY